MGGNSGVRGEGDVLIMGGNGGITGEGWGVLIKGRNVVRRVDVLTTRGNGGGGGWMYLL